MPIKIPNELPARATLEAEGVMLMREADAVRQDIRPMRIGLLNLMPNKIRTETQFARLLGSTPLQVELTLVKMTNHVARNTPSDHIISFYRDFEDIRAEKFDGFIVTGAPVETIPFEPDDPGVFDPGPMVDPDQAQPGPFAIGPHERPYGVNRPL